MTQTPSRHDGLSALIVDIIDTPDVRNALSRVCGQWFEKWGAKSVLKKAAAGPASWLAEKALASGETPGLTAVFEKPEHLEALFNEIPRLFQGLGGVILSVVHALECLPSDRKKAMIDRLFSGFSKEGGNRCLPSLVRMAEEVYQGDPTFLSPRILPLLDRWVAQTDFGELKNLFDTARDDIDALFKGLADLAFEYPAKLVTVLSVAPDAVNLVLSTVERVLGHVNAMPPDILTDLVLGLFRGIDAKTTGRIIHRINEAIRQIHTGSTLVGEMDAPQFTMELREKIRDFIGEIDPLLALKARNALIDGRETVLSELIAALEDRPELLNLWLSHLASARNADIRLFKRKIQVIETLPEEDAVSALAAGLSSWNAYDLADTVNAVSRMVNRIHRTHPGVLGTLVTEYVNTLDRYELEETLDVACRDIGQAVRPVFRMAAPYLVREFCGFFEPGEDDDGYDEAMDAARRHLAGLFTIREESER